MLFNYLDKYLGLAEEVVSTARYMFRTGLAHGTAGNVSARLSGGEGLLITPSGKNYGALSPQELCFVDWQGKVFSGNPGPSSELPLHLAAYFSRPDCKAVVHNHSTYASVLAVTRTDLPVIMDELTMVIGGGVKVAKYGFPGTQELALNFVEALDDRQAAILANHGMVAIGANLREAMIVCETVERVSRVFVEASRFGKIITIPNESYEHQREDFLRKKAHENVQEAGVTA